jgi:hypothetical protein
MLKSLCEFLNITSKYINYNEYHFLNEEIPLLHVLQFKIEVRKKIQRKEKTNEIYQNNLKLPQF